MLVMRRDRRLTAALLMSAVIFPLIASVILRVGQPNAGKRIPVLVRGQLDPLIESVLTARNELELHTDSASVAALRRPFITLRVEGSTYSVIGDATERSWVGAVVMSDEIRKQREFAIARRLGDMGLSPDSLSPFKVNLVDTTDAAARSAAFFGFLLPYLTVILLVTSMVRTIHIPVSEKEHRTLASLLVSRVPRTAIVIGKTLAILLYSVASAVLLFAGMATLVYLGVLKPPAGGEPMSLSLRWGQIGLLVLNLSSVALMLSSVMMAIGTYARSQREGGLFASPLIVITVFLAVFGLSGTEFGAPVYAAPLLGNVLGMRDTIRDRDTWLIFLPMLTNTLIFFAFTWLSSWMYRREAVLLRS
jgi:ABC-type Na+ efflux pump permease subunit